MIFNEEIKENEIDSLLLSSVSIRVGSSSDYMGLETGNNLISNINYSRRVLFYQYHLFWCIYNCQVINIYKIFSHYNYRTIYGAMYGLETLSQLITFNFSSRQYQINEGPWIIEDYPQFPHRSILLDTSRFFYFYNLRVNL